MNTFNPTLINFPHMQCSGNPEIAIDIEIGKTVGMARQLLIFNEIDEPSRNAVV